MFKESSGFNSSIILQYTPTSFIRICPRVETLKLFTEFFEETLKHLKCTSNDYISYAKAMVVTESLIKIHLQLQVVSNEFN